MVIVEDDTPIDVLKKEGARDKVHICMEGMTPERSTLQGQCGEYSIGFSLSRARFVIVLGLRGCAFMVLLFTAKARAKLASFDYRKRDQEVLKWLTFLLSDKAIDRGFTNTIKTSLDLLNSKQVEQWYGAGVRTSSSSSSTKDNKDTMPIQKFVLLSALGCAVFPIACYVRITYHRMAGEGQSCGSRRPSLGARQFHREAQLGKGWPNSQHRKIRRPFLRGQSFRCQTRMVC